jgi:flagellar biosynthesis chaperone FliJ
MQEIYKMLGDLVREYDMGRISAEVAFSHIYNKFKMTETQLPQIASTDKEYKELKEFIELANKISAKYKL